MQRLEIVAGSTKFNSLCLKLLGDTFLCLYDLVVHIPAQNVSSTKTCAQIMMINRPSVLENHASLEGKFVWPKFAGVCGPMKKKTSRTGFSFMLEQYWIGQNLCWAPTNWVLSLSLIPYKHVTKERFWRESVCCCGYMRMRGLFILIWNTNMVYAVMLYNNKD